MTNTNLNDLIDNLLNHSSFALIPHNPKVDKEQKFLFDFFINLNAEVLMRQFINYSDHIGLETALLTIAHYKGKVPYFVDSLDYINYMKIKPFLDENSLRLYSKLFQDTHINNILSGEVSNALDVDMNELKLTNLDKYIDVSIKIGLNNIVEVFNTDKFKVFTWINKHTNKYQQLKELKQPQFIFNNMNGKLDINDATLQYLFEICPIDLVVYKEVKKTIDLEIIWKFTKHKLTIDFIIELIDTLDEVIFILSLPDLPLSTIETVMKRLETKYPNMYHNFNSLLVMKKVFSQ